MYVTRCTLLNGALPVPYVLVRVTRGALVTHRYTYAPPCCRSVFNVTFLIVDPWQSCVCFIRSGVIRCTLSMMLSLDRMCQRGLHAMLWLHIGTLMHSLAAEPCSTAGLLFPSRCPSGTILLTPYSMVWDWQVSRAGPMLFYWPRLLYPYYSLLLFFLSLLSV